MAVYISMSDVMDRCYCGCLHFQARMSKVGVIVLVYISRLDVI